MNIYCCWPGLAAAWYRGMVRSLLVAVLFAWGICILLLATFVWPEWLGGWLRSGLWLLALLGWSVGTIWNHMQLKYLLATGTDESNEPFIEAQTAYLRGDWFEAEALLLEILERSSRDVEALLLLVGVLRHTKRWPPALRRLRQLELLEHSTPWQFEIAREWQLIQRSMAETAAPVSASDTSESAAAADETASSETEWSDSADSQAEVT